ncbi:MAG TPA: bifunctional demethylmenaquinone methyltransferase/2-methoxy-6-polyprenyl-1,4-benzoquinol methylase UbiE [Planctomycetaceae bacterium]|nr:bifunctional demethylmenaquinone methyltransferase/2-methoxy-6-polyprenyl-1,4-benzoquinol methylase UbiE [Planctomycetaceae bacterium]
MTSSATSVDKSAERIRELFGEISPRYDLLNHLLSLGIDVYWRWRTVRSVPLSADAPILDVCTGTGDLALVFWKKAKRRVSVVGADFTHAMLVRAAQKAARLRQRDETSGNGLPDRSVSFVEADALRLPFPDNRFQVVSVAFGLRNVADTDGGLREMARVCRPGGWVVVLEFSLPTLSCIRRLYLWYFRTVLPRVGQLLARNRQMAYHYLPESVSAFPQGEALAERMRACGLIDVSWEPMTFGIATLYCGQKPPER